MQRYEQGRPWEGVWRDCYDHVLAATPGTGGPFLHDGTAADAAEMLASSLLAELTPPWSRWFGLSPVDDAADPALAGRPTAYRAGREASGRTIEIEAQHRATTRCGVVARCATMEPSPAHPAPSTRRTHEQ